MFPITHYYLEQQFYEPTPLLAIGGIFPDIAAACGMDRNEAHLCGRELVDFCKENFPDAIDFACGVYLHGSREGGADYYADEFWEGGEKGWCFQYGKQYMNEVAEATQLDEQFVWWKSHNFAELGLELITDLRYPYLKGDLLHSLQNKQAQAQAAEVMKAFAHINSKKLLRVLEDAENIFELKNINVFSLAVNQHRGIIRRFDSDKSDIAKMAVVIKHISEDMLRNDDYDRFMLAVQEKMSASLPL